MGRRRHQKRSPATPGAGQTAPVKAAAAPAVSNRRKWLFRLAAFLSPLVLVAALEALLRLAGYGYPTAFILRSRIGGQDALVENTRFGWRFFDPALARAPRPQLFPAVKAAGTYRIFVLGESAAFGDPLPDFGLPRLLEVLLQDRYPGVRFEVVNAAMTAINSHVILPIARDCARHQGDLWVVYMGNNEVVGPFGSGTVFGPKAPGLGFVRASLALKATRTGELLADLSRRLRGGQAAAPEWGGMAMFLRQQVRQDDPRMAVVYGHWARNLEDILELGRAHGIKIVVSSVLSNVKDCAPFASMHRADLTEAQRAEWERVYEAAVEAEQAGHWAEAGSLLRKAAQLDDQFADLQFRWGQCCLELGAEAEAKEHLTLARDYDTLRFRADSRINAILGQTASGRERAGIVFFDAERSLAGQSPHGLPGQELLYEHVHLTFEGNYLLARGLTEQIVKLLPEAVARRADPQRTWLSAGECAARLAWSGWSRYEAAEAVMLRLNDPPFTSQLDHAARYERLRTRLEQLLPGVAPTALREAAAECRNALARRPADWVLAKNLGRLEHRLGDLGTAAASWREVVQLLPHSYEAHLQLGLLETQLGQHPEAIGQFKEALRLNSDCVPALNGWGLALVGEGKPSDALRLYAQALKLSPASCETHLNLGMALEALGLTSEAKGHFRRALERKLNSAETLVTLGKMCLSQGWAGEAITNFTSALRLNPADATAHFCLAGVAVSQGRPADAESHFAEAVRLNPDFAEARVGLGVQLGRQGHAAEAVEQFTEAVRLKPGFTEARLNLGIGLLKLNRSAQALAEFQEVLRREPQNAAARRFSEVIQAAPAKP